MRIISPFKDYYDCIQLYGQDDTIIWLRKMEKMKIKNRECSLFNNKFRADQIFDFVGFCGKLYPFFRFNYYNANKNKYVDVICYGLEDVTKFIDNHYTKQQKKTFYSRTKKYLGSSFDQIKKGFEFLEKEKNKHEDFFVENKCPIFVTKAISITQKLIIFHGRQSNLLHDSELTEDLTFSLKNHNFERIIDPFTAFQNVSIYVGGVLGTNSPPIPKVSDKDMREAKGFDNWSFKKEKKK